MRLDISLISHYYLPSHSPVIKITNTASAPRDHWPVSGPRLQSTLTSDQAGVRAPADWHMARCSPALSGPQTMQTQAECRVNTEHKFLHFLPSSGQAPPAPGIWWSQLRPAPSTQPPGDHHSLITAATTGYWPVQWGMGITMALSRILYRTIGKSD